MTRKERKLLRELRAAGWTVGIGPVTLTEERTADSVIWRVRAPVIVEPPRRYVAQLEG